MSLIGEENLNERDQNKIFNLLKLLLKGASVKEFSSNVFSDVQNRQILKNFHELNRLALQDLRDTFTTAPEERWRANALQSLTLTLIYNRDLLEQDFGSFKNLKRLSLSGSSPSSLSSSEIGELFKRIPKNLEHLKLCFCLAHSTMPFGLTLWDFSWDVFFKRLENNEFDLSLLLTIFACVEQEELDIKFLLKMEKQISEDVGLLEVQKELESLEKKENMIYFLFNHVKKSSVNKKAPIDVNPPTFHEIIQKFLIDHRKSLSAIASFVYGETDDLLGFNKEFDQEISERGKQKLIDRLLEQIWKQLSFLKFDFEGTGLTLSEEQKKAYETWKTELKGHLNEKMTLLKNEVAKQMNPFNEKKQKSTDERLKKTKLSLEGFSDLRKIFSPFLPQILQNPQVYAALFIEVIRPSEILEVITKKRPEQTFMHNLKIQNISRKVEEAISELNREPRESALKFINHFKGIFETNQKLETIELEESNFNVQESALVNKLFNDDLKKVIIPERPRFQI